MELANPSFVEALHDEEGIDSWPARSSRASWAEALGLVVVMESQLFGPTVVSSFETQPLWAASAHLSGEPAA